MSFCVFIFIFAFVFMSSVVRRMFFRSRLSRVSSTHFCLSLFSLFFIFFRIKVYEEQMTSDFKNCTRYKNYRSRPQICAVQAPVISHRGRDVYHRAMNYANRRLYTRNDWKKDGRWKSLWITLKSLLDLLWIHDILQDWRVEFSVNIMCSILPAGEGKGRLQLQTLVNSLWICSFRRSKWFYAISDLRTS